LGKAGAAYDTGSVSNPADTASLKAALAEVPAEKINTAGRKAALQGLRFVSERKYDQGSQLLNAAVKLDPTNSYLQLANAYAYDQMGRSGDSEKYSLAEQGYKLAAKFDASNWFAHYLLGMMYSEQRNFRAAQEQFAEVLLSLGDDREVLFRMVAAAYYAGDPVTSSACLEKLRSLDPNDPNILRLSALMSAAINQPKEANRWLDEYKATQPQSTDLNHTERRLDQWDIAFRSPQHAVTGELDPDVKLAQAVDSLIDGGSNNISGGLGDTNGGFSVTGGAQENIAVVDPTASRMVLVDVVIVRTEDTFSSRKGVNLLNLLNLQFGGRDLPAWSSSYSDITKDGRSSETSSVTRAISIPALNYSLNIVNSNTNLNEVLARPTLTALEGVSSEFFSGSTLNAAAVSGNGIVGSSIQIEKEIGVTLKVLPTFLPDGKIRIAVDAQRTFLKPPSQDVSYTYKLETSKIMLNANVVMEFGETLVLGGLSERETNNNRDGVPVMQDVPGLQYLFAKRDTSDFQRSVLLLITPRSPQYTYRNEVTKSDSEVDADQGMQELRARYGDWFNPYPNLASVFSHMNASSIYREFRTGDVTLEQWDRQDTRSARLRQALDFLFY